VQLFEILQDGFHTPLNETQIAELFNAGRLGRHTRCKPVKQTEWRTIDELFPLLKYHAPLQFSYQHSDSNSEFPHRRTMVFAIGLVAAAAATMVIFFFFSPRESSSDRRITAIHSVSTSAAPSYSRPAPASTTQRIQHTISAATAPPSSYPIAVADAIRPVQLSQSEAAIRSAEAQRILEQARRDQAVAAQQRAMHEQKLLEQEKAAGKDQHVLLDHWQAVNVGGISVSVKIHDNDTTSFDVWINGEHHRDVKKEKGVTGSRADETFIYGNGRATLYYVWEISGRLDHCLLRVRDA
jgi:hypothetical protein